MGHRSFLGTCAAADGLPRCQKRRASSKAGAKQNFEFQNDSRIRRRKEEPKKNPFKGYQQRKEWASP